MLRHRRLRDAELVVDGVAHRTGLELPVVEELQDPPADRVTEDVERVHDGPDYQTSLILVKIDVGSSA